METQVCQVLQVLLKSHLVSVDSKDFYTASHDKSKEIDQKIHNSLDSQLNLEQSYYTSSVLLTHGSFAGYHSQRRPTLT